MPRARPSTITVIAVFQIVFAGFAILGDLLGGAQMLAGSRIVIPTPQGQTQAETRDEATRLMDEQFPAHRIFQAADVAASLVLSLLMLTSGIALIGMKPWGRVLGLTTAVGIVLLKIAELADLFIVVLPVMNQVAEILREKGTNVSFAAPIIPLVGYGIVFAKIYTIPYHLVVATLLLLPSTSAAFRGGPQQTKPTWNPLDEGRE